MSCKLNVRCIWRKILKVIKVIVSMEKKRVDALVYTLLVFGGVLLSFYAIDLKTNVGIINVFIKTLKPYVLLVGICCFMPPLAFLISNIIAPVKSKEYNEEPIYRVLKSLTHLCLIALGTFSFGWIWALLTIGLAMIIETKLAIIISSIIVIVLLFVVTILIENNIKIKYYQFWYWVK